MKPKNLLIVVILLAAVSVAAWFLNRPTPPPSARDARIGKPILETAAAEKASQVSLTENGKTVILTRSGDTGWEVASYHQLPVDFTKLAALVKTLNATDVERLVTSSPDRISRLEFTDTKIVVAAAEKSLLYLTLGKNADTGGGRYLRFNDENKAYLARLNLSLDVESRNWADTTLVRFSASDIASITYPFSTPFTVSRTSATSPFTTNATPEGQRLKPDAVTSLLSTLANLRFTDTAALDAPQAIAARDTARTVTLTTFDGKTLTIALGRQPERTVAKTDATRVNFAAFGALQPDPLGLLGTLTERLPAGPVFAFITHSHASAPVNALMKKRAFQVSESALNAIPTAASSLFEALPPPPPPAESAAK
ncbi:MAG: DUF4340 domain-containing protein [Rariglobus sp.]